MILLLPKVPILNACRFSAEYVMRLLSRSESGCERRINHRTLVQSLCPEIYDRRKR